MGEKEGGRGGGEGGERKREICAHAPQRDSIQAQERKKGGERLRGKTGKSDSGGRGPGALVAALAHAMYGWVMSHMRVYVTKSHVICISLCRKESRHMYELLMNESCHV